jgi:hypothetical protein
MDSQQLKLRRAAEAEAAKEPSIKPVMQFTAAVVVLLLIGSATYDALT